MLLHRKLAKISSYFVNVYVRFVPKQSYFLSHCFDSMSESECRHRGENRDEPIEGYVPPVRKHQTERHFAADVSNV